MKVSRVLEEVWRWKDEVARDTEDMTVSQQIVYFRQANDRLAKKTGQQLHLPPKRKKNRADRL